MFGMDAFRFAQLMRQAGDGDIELHIQSPGGAVDAGFAIANMLKVHKGRKIAVVDGFCASAATFAAMACDEVHMHAQSVLMIHSSMAIAIGGAADMESMRTVLSIIDETVSQMYAAKSGASAETVAEWMSKDTYFKPADALAAKLIDKIIETPAKQASAKATARAAQFFAKHHAPDELRAFLNQPPAAPAAVRFNPPSGAPRMKSTPNTRGLRMALAAVQLYASACAGSQDADEQALGASLTGADAIPVKDIVASLADITDAPDPAEVMAVYAKAVELTGSSKGVVGGLDAIAGNAARKGVGAGMDKMAQVNMMLDAAVSPPKGKLRKLTTAQAAAQRSMFAKDPDKSLDDLESFIRLSHSLPALNQIEDHAAGGSPTASTDDPEGGEIDAEVRKYALAGKVIP